jgi:hypothetical protein
MVSALINDLVDGGRPVVSSATSPDVLLQLNVVRSETATWSHARTDHYTRARDDLCGERQRRGRTRQRDSMDACCLDCRYISQNLVAESQYSDPATPEGRWLGTDGPAEVILQ